VTDKSLPKRGAKRVLVNTKFGLAEFYEMDCRAQQLRKYPNVYINKTNRGFSALKNYIFQTLNSVAVSA